MSDAPGLETCGCCEGIAAATPVGLFNRAGLDAIRYRIGDYGQFRQTLQAGLSSSAFPQLTMLRTRDADDYTIALLDAVACAADVLTFYQERLANESWLRTATERVSLQELAKLTGYRLRPGVAAETRLAFALEPPRAAPPGLAPEPGAFVTGIPGMLTLAAGLKVQSVPGPDEKPQTFETIEEIDARPEWNAIRPWLSEVRYPGSGDTDAWLAGTGNNLKPGDALVLADDAFLKDPAHDRHWDFRLIDTVEPYPEDDRTRVTWGRGLGSLTPDSAPAPPPQVHVLRRRAAVYGHNAPVWLSMNASFRKGYVDATPNKADTPDQPDWTDFTISQKKADPAGGHIDLDGVLGEVRAGSLVVLAKGEYNRPAEGLPADACVELYLVTSTAEVSRADFAMSGKVTRLGLSGQRLDTQFFKEVRATTVFAQSEALRLAPAPVKDKVAGAALPLVVAADGLVAGRRLIVHGDHVDGDGNLVHKVHEATISSVARAPNGTLLTIAPPLPAPLERATVVVHANVASATHGETGAQILGNGDAGRSFQRFELTRLPLTWRSGSAMPELSVRVGDVEWTGQPTLFGAASTDRAYSLTVDEQGKNWVVFGDGVRGARLPSGLNNVRARYRQGLGKEGNVASDKLTQLMTRPLGLKSVSNPVAARGGVDPEPASQARHAMPLGTRTLGRVVSVLDYEDFALAFADFAKAQARVLQLRAGPTVAVTVAGADGAQLLSSDAAWIKLLAAYRASGDPHVNVVLLPYQKTTFHLGLKIKRDPAWDIKPLLAAVKAALLAHFAFDARALGQPVLQSEVIAVAHAVPGVVAVDLDLLYAAGTARAPHARLLASHMHVQAGVAMPAQLLTLDAESFDWLKEMP